MLETAKNGKVPEYVELTFHIDKNESVKFWENRDTSEILMLFREWSEKPKGRFKKSFYGIKFAIQFDDSSERLTYERHETANKLKDKHFKFE